MVRKPERAKPSEKSERSREFPRFPPKLFRPVYNRLRAKLGPSQWWPGDSPFEVMVGAILTQNTSWKNVERAIAELKRHRLLRPRRMHALPPEELAPLIRSSGYYNQKAKKLHALLDWYSGYGYSVARIQRAFPPERRDALRRELLELRGVGPETADSILCYALGMPFFVVDAYTMRWLERYAPEHACRDYEPLRAAVEAELACAVSGEAEFVQILNEFHALIVRLCARICTKRRPDCEGCPLRRTCRRNLSEAESRRKFEKSL